MPAEESVFVVDDDEAARESLAWLLTSVGYSVVCYPSANAFLENYDGRAGCLILDVRMPGMSGLNLQQELQKHNWPLSSILVTGHGDVPMAVAAMRAGALDFLQKPFNNQSLLDRTEEALSRARALRHAASAKSEIETRFGRLTCREREVAWLVFAGKPNKVIADNLSLSCKTVEAHRASMMAKMQTHSVADLVQKLSLLRPSETALASNDL